MAADRAGFRTALCPWCVLPVAFLGVGLAGLFGSTALYSIGLAGATLSIVIASLRSRCPRVAPERMGWLGASMFLYLLALALSAGLGLRPETSFPEVLKVKFFLVAWAVVAVGSDRRVLSILVVVMALASLYACSYAIYEHHHPGDWTHQVLARGRVAGPASDTIDLSARLLPMLAFAAGLWAAAPSGSRERSAAAVWCVFAGLALSYTSTRSNLAGLVAALVVGAAVGRRRSLLVLALLVSSLAAVPNSPLTERYVVGRDATSSSDQYRLDVLRVGLSIARDFFPWGVGRSNFVLVHDQRRAPDQVSKLSSHNNYLDLLCECGLLGLAAFLWMHWAFLARVVPALRGSQEADPLREGLLLGSLQGFVAFMVFGLFHSNWTYLLPPAVLCALLGFGWSAAGWAPSAPAGRSPNL